MTDFFELESLTVTKINAVCFVAPGTGKPRHINRSFHGLVFYEDDSCVFDFDDGNTLPTARGTVLYLPKHSSYRVRKSKVHSGCYAINFDTLETPDLAPSAFTVKNYAKFQSLFSGTEKMWNSKQPGYMHCCKAALYEILGNIHREAESVYVPSAKKARLLPAVQYIMENYTSCDMRTDTLASLCGISPAYFRRMFFDVYAMPPVKYINSLRIARAKELLLSDMHTTGDISALCGFRDECYFRRVFKAETGYSPGRFLKSFK